MNKPYVSEHWRRQMREDWDQRAQDDTTHFTAGLETRPAVMLRPVFERLGFDPIGKRVLDIGCGVGRLFPGFAEMGFGEIWGIDVSPEMIERGRRRCSIPQARFLVGSGDDLTGVSSAAVDYCFSYSTFEGIPRLNIVWRYLDHIYRVLRSGGAFQLHFRSRHLFTARVALLLPTRLRAMAQVAYRLATFGWLRGHPFRPTNVPGTLETRWGTPVSPGQLTRKLSSLGFVEVEILSDPPLMDRKLGMTRTPSRYESQTHFWAIGRKP